MVFVGMNLAGGDLLHKVRYDSCIWHGSCIYPDSYVGRGLARLLRAQQSGRCGNALERLALCGVYSLNIFKKPRFDGGLRRPLLTHTPLHRPYIV